MFWIFSILLSACLGIALSACESKGQQPDSALDTNPFTDNIVQESGEDTMAGPMVIINQAGLEPEKGMPGKYRADLPAFAAGAFGRQSVAGVPAVGHGDFGF